jgi:hypothetical protein
MRQFTAAAIAVLVIAGCGDTGPTQAQKAADQAQAKAVAAQQAAWLAADKAAAAAIAAARATEITQGHAYSVAVRIPVIDLQTRLAVGVDIIPQSAFNVGVAAKGAPGEIPVVPGCLSAIDAKFRTAFSNIYQDVLTFLEGAAHDYHPNDPTITTWDEPWFDMRNHAVTMMDQGREDLYALINELGGIWCVWMT